MVHQNRPAVRADDFFDQKPVNERLLRLAMRTGYNCFQKNGQRYYGPPPNWVGPPPERGSEVFVGRIPRDLFEDELVPVFEAIATIYEVRLMMNFTGFNRGFAFVTFFNAREAWRAVILLNNFEIRPGHKIGVSKSIDNCRLYLGGILLDKCKADCWEELTKICPNVKDIIMYPNPEDRRKNRGFLFIEFDSHRSAAMAKRSLVPGTVKMWDQDIIVDWADPEPDVDPNIMATITKLFIRNLTVSFTAECIQKLLLEVVPFNSIQKIYIAGHYGFLHFDKRMHAQIAKEKLSLICLDGEMLEVHWARPKCYRKAMHSSFCRSLPPRMRRDRNNNYCSTPIGSEPPMMQPMLPPVVPQIMPQEMVPQMVPHQMVQPQSQMLPQDINGNYKPPVPMYQTVQYPGYAASPVVYTHNPMSFYTQ